MLIESLVREGGGAPAIVRSNGDALSYDALRAAISRASRELAARGARGGRAVGVAVADPCGFVVASLAAWDAGAAVVPLDSRAGDGWIAAAARRAGVVATVTSATVEGALELTSGEGAPIDERAALVLFTSGSSAEPKAVLLSSVGIDANVRAIVRYLPIAAHPRTAVVVPLSYSYGLVGQVLTTLHVGATLLLLGDVVFPPLQVDAMRALDARGLSTVPTSLRVLARALAERPAQDAPSLGYVASAGGPLDASTIAATRAAFRGARLYNQYGLTEASPRVAAIDDGEPAFARGSVGRALAGTEVWAACPDGSRAPPGVEGELVIRGPSIMLGYLGDPAGTARVLSGDGALRTGDAGYVDDEGYLFVSGRCDGVVKCGGERVSVEEIAALLRTHAGVREACVIAVPHTDLGATLHAFVEGSTDVVPQLRRLVRALPPAKRPARFTALAALPRTANGKIARAELVALHDHERESPRARDDEHSRREVPR